MNQLLCIIMYSFDGKQQSWDHNWKTKEEKLSLPLGFELLSLGTQTHYATNELRYQWVALTPHFLVGTKASYIEGLVYQPIAMSKLLTINMSNWQRYLLPHNECILGQAQANLLFYWLNVDLIACCNFFQFHSIRFCVVYNVQ